MWLFFHEVFPGPRNSVASGVFPRALSKWPTFSKWYFQYHFLKKILVYLLSKFRWIIFIWVQLTLSYWSVSWGFQLVNKFSFVSLNSFEKEVEQPLKPAANALIALAYIMSMVYAHMVTNVYEMRRVQEIWPTIYLLDIALSRCHISIVNRQLNDKSRLLNSPI